MKKSIKIRVLLLILLVVVLLVPKKLFAIEFIEPFEYTEAYKKYLELSEEERKGVLVPRIYKIPTTYATSTNPLRLLKARSVTDSTYSLQNDISKNMIIKNQGKTNSCWAFASIACLETNLALKDYYNGDTSNVYDFSERHMEYATSRTFLDGINEKGFYREVGDGGNWGYSEPYLINGYGAISESQMPFENNENKINLSKIQNKTTVTKVIDTVWFDSKTPDEVTTADMNKIKEHILKNGAICSGMVSNSSYYNSTTGAYYCNSRNYAMNHGIAIVGWNDNYSVNNFKIKPSKNGAWIIKNSWGTSSGKDGYIFISYEDAWIYEMMWGVQNSSTNIDYDNIYFYNEYGNTAHPGLKTKALYMATVFNKKTSGTEYLNEIALNVLDTYDCTVYVNPNGTSKALEDLQQVELKAGTKETLEAGYHTLEFKRPIRITGNSFTIVVKEETKQKDYTLVALEAKMPDTDDWDCVKTEKGKCFITAEEYIMYDYWEDCSQLSSTSEGYWPDGDLTIRAFTTNTSNDYTLKEIKITTPPTKTTYIEGDNFDKTGMVVTAFYNNGDSEIVTDYNIENGTDLKEGQTAVIIKYEDKQVTQTITVEANSVTKIEITTPPTKTTYIEGDNFDKTGMVVTATYKKGTKATVTNYDVLDGTNLKANQATVTIKYGEQTATQKITVEANSVTKIEITTPPTKTVYFEGENFDKTGMVVTATYKNGARTSVTNYDVLDGTNLKANQTTVTIKYGEQTATQKITVETNSIIKIEITTPPTKTTYIEGENFDKTGMVVTATHKNGTRTKVTNYEILYGTNLKINQTTVTISYNGQTATQKITVEKNNITKIEITTPPTKTTYIEGENLDKTGMVVTAIYKNGTKTKVTNYEVLYGTNLRVGQTEVTISYGGQTVNQRITVETNSITNIEVTTPPTKTVYFEGEDFDKTGMVVTATHKNGIKEAVINYNIINGTNLKVGQTEVTISYGGQTVNQRITVETNSITNIEVTTPPTKTVYFEGEDFDKTGMVVTATHKNGIKEAVINYNIINGTKLQEGQSAVTIKYLNKITTQKITVEGKKVVSIEIVNMPTKLTYVQNRDDLNLTGGKIKAIYNDETYEEINMTSNKINVTGFNNEKIGIVKITIEYKTLKTTFDVTITEPETARNSDFEKAEVAINTIKLYIYTDPEVEDYELINVEINGIIRSTANDSFEYYYYLSPNQSEDRIQNWVKIKETQNKEGKLIFTINTKDLSNYAKLLKADDVYLYIEEIAKKGGDQKVQTYGAFKLEDTDKTETYLDDVKYEEIEQNTSEDTKKDSTVSKEILPNTGDKLLIIFVVIAIVGAALIFVKYRTYKDIR